MYLRVPTSWSCWQRRLDTTKCEGHMIVIEEDNFHSVCCDRCNVGIAGAGPLPEGYITRLFDEGYIRKIAQKPVDADDLRAFFAGCINYKRSAYEITDDLLERYQVFQKQDS